MGKSVWSRRRWTWHPEGWVVGSREGIKVWAEEHTRLAGGGDRHVALQGCATKWPEKVEKFP